MGRFAPSPTGPLHFGSLLAALASYLDVRHAGGRWLVRMENLDRAREKPGAADQILRDLEAFGFEWDGAVLRQTDRLPYYRSAFKVLEQDGLLYGCSCSRRLGGGRCAAACAEGRFSNDKGSNGKSSHNSSNRKNGLATVQSVRVRVPDQVFCVADAVQGCFCQNLLESVGDFVVKRADGPFSYQLAVVVDDAEQGVTNVVRGCDLLDNTPRQIFLQKCLGYATPDYAHIPVAVDADGVKLSKSAGAAALTTANAGREIARALDCLGQPLPAEASRLPARELLRWAVAHWCLGSVPHASAVRLR